MHVSTGKVSAAVLLACVAVLGSLATFFAQTNRDGTTPEEPSPSMGSPAPEFSLSSLDGNQVSLSTLRGQVVLVNFWATWCVPCRAEMPAIQAAYESYRTEGLTVLAINQGEDKETVARFVQEFHITFPVLLDGNETVVKRFDVRGLPTSFFVDRETFIRGIRFGEMSGATIASQLALLGVPAISELAIPLPTSATTGGPQRVNVDEIFPPGEGRDLVVETCLTCHDLLTFGLARKTRDGWIHSLAKHGSHFSALSNAQIETMYEYLSAHLNPDTPISKQIPPGYWCGT
jgi:cytochrome c biogenesis protein CcmG/thiol:disulfide interchange protein DsbE